MILKQETINTLRYYGFDTLKDYLQDLADEHGVPYSVVKSLASCIGESEFFDGLVVMVEDAEGMVW